MTCQATYISAIHSYIDVGPIPQSHAMIPALAHFSFIQPGEWGQYTDDIRQLFVELADERGDSAPSPAGTCRPSVDVFETDEVIELIVDASGMTASSLRVLFRGGVVVVAGEKLPPRRGEAQVFHQVERDFGRFARVLQLSGAFDVNEARASLASGELTITIPKRVDRRDQPRRIAITASHERPS
jgi:HSP20 family protein